jgi:high affinity choline transporter 7
MNQDDSGPRFFQKLKPSLILIIALLALGGGMTYFGQKINWPGYLMMIFFYALIFLMGTYAAHLGKRKAKLNNISSTDSMMLAGRNMPLGLAVFTMSATWVGGGYINGTAEYTAGSGLVWVQAPWGYALSLILGGLFFAKKMRRYKFKTMLDPLEQRFGKKMAGLLYLPALTGETFWTAAILTALGTTFGTILGLEFNASIIISSIIAITYTALGGLWAVALTDVIQMILLLVGLFVVLYFSQEKVGGLERAWELYKAKKGSAATLIPSLDNLKNYYFHWWDYALLLTFGGIPWHVYFQRVLSSKDEKTAQRMSIMAGFICIIAAIPAVLIGIIGDVADWSSMGLVAPDANVILPTVVAYLTNPVVATVGLGAIAAAVMSSVDSSILSASSMAGWNVYRPLINPDVSSKNLAKIIQKCIWIIGIGATLLALKVKSVYTLWFLCSDFVYCILFPQLVFALFDKKANTWGSFCGFTVALLIRVSGGEVVLGIGPLFKWTMTWQGMDNVIMPFRTIAMVSSCLTIFIVSRFTQKWDPAKELKINED